MDNSLISVIIPVYNTAKYLDECLQSVMNQTYKNFEIILVDDESPDESPQICDRWAGEYENIQVIHKKNGGLGFARNSGLEIAKGDYVCFFDSDDTLDDNTFELCIGALDINGADACFYGRKTGKIDGSYSINTNVPDKLVYEGDEVIKEFANTYLGPMPSSEGLSYIQASACCGMYRRSIIEGNNIRFLSERQYLSEDTFFNLDFCKNANKIIIIPEDLYNYRYNQSSLTKKYNPNRFNQLKLYYGKLLEYKDIFSDAEDIDIRVPYQFYVYLRHTVEYEVKSYKFNGLINTYKRIKQISDDDFVKTSLKDIRQDMLSTKRKMFVKWMISGNVVPVILMYMVK